MNSLDSFREALNWPSAHFQSSSSYIKNPLEPTCGKKKHKGQKKKEKKRYKKKRNKEINKKRMLADKNRQFVKCTFRPTKTFQHSCVKGARALFLLFIFLCQNACLCYMRLIPVLHMDWDPLQWAINGQSNIQAPQTTSPNDPSWSPDKASLHAALFSVHKQNDHHSAH